MLYVYIFRLDTVVRYEAYMMAEQKTQQEILQDAWKREKIPDEMLQEARQKLKGPGENCRCMPAFTCLFCANAINEWHRKEKEKELLANQCKNNTNEDTNEVAKEEEADNNVSNDQKNDI